MPCPHISLPVPRCVLAMKSANETPPHIAVRSWTTDGWHGDDSLYVAGATIRVHFDPADRSKTADKNVCPTAEIVFYSGAPVCICLNQVIPPVRNEHKYVPTKQAAMTGVAVGQSQATTSATLTRPIAVADFVSERIR